jgi:hypothetical protein
LHERAMERCAHLQRNRTPRAERFRAIDRPRYSGRRSGDDDLTRGVEVRGTYDVTIGSFAAGPLHEFGLETKNCGHCTGTDGHGLLHVTASISQNAHGIAKVDGARRDMRGVLAQAVTRHHRGTTAPRLERAICRDTCGENRRLCVLRESEPIGWTVEDQSAEWLPKRTISLVEHRLRFGKLFGEGFAHADGLRTLTWKKESDHPSTRLRSPGASPTDADAISCSTRLNMSLPTNRAAIVTAFRTALAEERP